MRVSFISSRAKRDPGQTRGPWPKAKKPFLACFRAAGSCVSHRSGRNWSTSGPHTLGSLWMAYGETATHIPLPTLDPALRRFNVQKTQEPSSIHATSMAGSTVKQILEMRRLCDFKSDDDGNAAKHT